MARTIRLDSLTGLRFLAALLVFASHVGDLALPGRSGYGPNLLDLGRIGVSFFFVLSGFVLTWAGSDADGRTAFYRRRMARIFPNHLVTWAIALAVFGGGSLLGRLLALPLVQAWSPRGEEHYAANPVSWSLSVEVFFYAVFPFAIGPLRRLGRHALLVAGAVLLGCVVAAPFVAEAILGGYQAFWAVYLFPAGRLPEFLLGAVLALALTRNLLPRLDPHLAGVVVLGSLALSAALPPNYRTAATILPFALLILAMGGREADGTTTWAGQPWLVRLGEWSFAFYLVHLFALDLVDRAVGFDGRRLVTVAGLATVSLAIAIGFAALLYTLVERPAEHRLRHRRRATAPETPEASRHEPLTAPGAREPKASVAAGRPLEGRDG